MLAGSCRGQTTARGLLTVWSLLAFACDEAGRDEERARDGSVIERREDGAISDVRELDASVPALDAAVTRWASLVDNELWRRYDAAVDPLKSHQPETISCFPSATYIEYDSYEVDTTRCNYLLAYTPSQRAVPAGTTVRLDLLHYDLLAPMPAEAHLALLFGDVVQWEQSIPIPSPGNQIEATFQTKTALGLLDPIRLHLHNHGGNTYLLVALEAAAP